MCEDDFINLACHCVPKERAGLLGKALFAGYRDDFVTALHLLVPQIENFVREVLKQAGVETKTLDNDGIENEKAMGSLIQEPKANEVFGEDLAFELNSLFCDPAGPNLRNKVAHGLLDEGQFDSPYAIYAWWLGLRLVVNTWWSVSNTTQN